MHVCHFEDRASQFEPLSLTRPVFDLMCGMTTLAQKQRRYFAAERWSVVVRPALADWYRSEHPGLAVNGEGTFQGEDQVLVNGRWLPPDGSLEPPTSSCAGMAEGSIAYVYLRKRDVCGGDLTQLIQHALDSAPAVAAGGRMLGHPWDLLEANADEIRRDFGWRDAPPSPPTVGQAFQPDSQAGKPDLRQAGGGDWPLPLSAPRGHRWIAPPARIEPMVVVDTSDGPVVIDDGAVVTAFTRLEGPCWIGPHTHVFSAKIRAGTSLGPCCRVGGEIEASILHGYSNKYHDGFLGHSYVGEWVNLGAGTHNSDLRNDYGEVSVVQHGQSIATGMTKVGCFLGDHTKTGLGTLLNTGTNVGAFCNLLPAGRFAPKYVPPFTSWWNGALTEAFTLEQLLTTAEIAMKRRGVTLTEASKALYAQLLDGTAAERRRALRDSEQRLLRKSA